VINASIAFKEALISPISEVYVKLELLDHNENLLSTITQQVSSDSIGDISVDKTRDIRRMFTLPINNKDGTFVWGENNLIWMDNKRVKLYIGLKTPNGIEYVPEGVFVLTQPEATHKIGQNTITLNGQDKMYLLTGNFGKFTHITTINKGTNITEAIKIVATEGGIDKLLLQQTDITLPYDLTYQIDQNRSQSIKELAEKAVWDVYFDVNGYLRFEPFKDPLVDPSCWSYKVEDITLYAGSTRKLDDTTLFNHILVMGGSSDVAEFRTELIIDNTLPEWANHPYSIQNIGDRLFCWNDGNPDSNIDTQSQCDARAIYELNKNLVYSEKVSIDMAPNYLHEANDIIEVVDSENGCIGTYQLEQFSIPIKPKITTSEAVKINHISTS